MKKALSNFLVNLLIRKSAVLANQKIGETFQLVTIKHPSRKIWYPGQKIQIKVTPKELRSYTPSKWENDQRTFQTLIYNHKGGPGALWAQKAKAGLKTQVVGPRNSLDIRERLEPNVIFFGDETTFGLGAILRDNYPDKKFTFFWEVNELHESSTALAYLKLNSESMVVRDQAEKHLHELIELILPHYNKDLIILSGKLSSINFLQKTLILKGIESEKIIKKKYWGWKPKSAV